MEKQSPILKTAHQWYQEDYTIDIIDPDGWRQGDVQNQYQLWFAIPITWQEYVKRRNRCTVMIYMSRNHRSPYDERKFPYGSLRKYLKKRLE